MLVVVGHLSACLTNRIRPVLSVRLKTPPAGPSLRKNDRCSAAEVAVCVWCDYGCVRLM